MDFLSRHHQEIMIGFLALLLFLLSLAILSPILKGLSNALKIIRGNYQLRLTEGRLNFHSGPYLQRSMYYYNGVRVRDDGERLFNCEKLYCGPNLKKSGLIFGEAWGGWLTASFSGGDSLKRACLLGCYTEGEVFFCKRDLLKLYDLEFGHAAFAGLLVSTLSFLFLFSGQAYFQGPFFDWLRSERITAVLLSGLAIFAALTILHEAAYARLKGQAKRALISFAKRPAVPKNSESLVKTAKKNEWIYWPLYLIFLPMLVAPNLFLCLYGVYCLISFIFILYNASFSNRLELRSLKILGHGPAETDYFGRTFYREGLLRDLRNGGDISVNRLYVADYLTEGGLISDGREGGWLVFGQGLNHNSDTKLRALSLNAYYDGATLHYSSDDLLRLRLISETSLFWMLFILPLLINAYTYLENGFFIIPMSVLAFSAIGAAMILLIISVLKKNALEAADNALKHSLPTYYCSKCGPQKEGDLSRGPDQA